MAFQLDSYLKLEVVSSIGIAVPFSCARLLLTCQGGRAKLPLLTEKLKSSTSQAAFEVALHRCLRTWKNRGSCISPETVMQKLGVAIAHGADEELVFGFLAASTLPVDHATRASKVPSRPTQIPEIAALSYP